MVNELQKAFNKGQSSIGFTIDYWLWKKKTGDMLTKVIPFASITARKIAEMAHGIIQKATPRTKTGTDLRGMWELKHSKKATREDFIIKNLYPKQEVIIFFEEGTKAHMIFPVNKRCLRFFVDGGTEVHSKRVSHPGTKAYGMLQKAEQWAQPRMEWYQKEVFKFAEKIHSQKGKG